MDNVTEVAKRVIEREKLVAEMAKQASLGHRMFCAGVHVHEGGGEEWEWVEWSEAFARLMALT